MYSYAVSPTTKTYILFGYELSRSYVFCHFGMVCSWTFHITNDQEQLKCINCLNGPGWPCGARRSLGKSTQGVDWVSRVGMQLAHTSNVIVFHRASLDRFGVQSMFMNVWTATNSFNSFRAPDIALFLWGSRWFYEFYMGLSEHNVPPIRKLENISCSPSKQIHFGEIYPISRSCARCEFSEEFPNSQGPVGSKERGAQVDFGAGVGEQPVHLLDEPEAGDGWEIGQLSILWKYII